MWSSVRLRDCGGKQQVGGAEENDLQNESFVNWTEITHVSYERRGGSDVRSISWIRSTSSVLHNLHSQLQNSGLSRRDTYQNPPPHSTGIINSSPGTRLLQGLPVQ